MVTNKQAIVLSLSSGKTFSGGGWSVVIRTSVFSHAVVEKSFISRPHNFEMWLAELSL